MISRRGGPHEPTGVTDPIGPTGNRGRTGQAGTFY